MKKYIFYFILFFGLFWLVEGLVDYYTFEEDYKFMFRVSIYELFMMILFISIFLFYIVNKIQKENEIRYKRLVESSFDAILISRFGICLNTNNLVYKMTGYEDKDIIGQNVLKFVHDDYKELVYDNIKNNIESEYKIFGIKKDGTTFPCEIKSKMDSDQIRITTIKDVTFDNKNRNELIESLKILQINEEKFRLLTENSIDLIWSVDLNLRFTYVSPAIFNMLGYTAEEIIGEHIKKFFAKDSLNKLINTFTKHYHQRENNGDVPEGSYELEGYKKDKSKIWVEIKTTPLRKNNEIIGIQGVTRNIDNIKKIRDELKKSEKQYRCFFENISDYVYIHDMEGNLLNTNFKHKKELALTSEEIKNLNLIDIIPKRFRFGFKSYLDIIKKNKKSSGIMIFENKHPVQERVVVYNNILIENEYGVYVQGSARDITDSLEAKKALKESEKRSKLWINSSPVCTKVVDLDFNLQFMSEAGVRDLEINIEEYYGKSYPLEFYPESFKTKMLDDLKKSKESLQIIINDGSVVSLNGKIIYYHSSIVPIVNGKLQYFLVISTNITEQKLAELALRKSEKQYRNLIEVANEGVFISQDHKWVFANKKAMELFGVTSENMVGQNLYDFIDEEDVPMMKDFHIRRLKGEILPTQYNFRRLFKPNNCSKWSMMSATTIVWHNEPAVLCFISDIDEKMKMQEELKHNEKKFRMLAENQYDVFWVVDENLKYNYISPSCERLIGYSVKEVLASTPELFFDSESYNKLMNKFAKEMQKPLSEKTGIIIEINQLKKDGTNFPSELTCTPILIDNEFKGIQGITRDITERIESQKALKESEEKFKNIFDNTNSAVAVYEVFIDSENKIEFYFSNINKRCMEIEKITKDVIGKNLEDLFPNIKKMGLIDVMIQVYEDGVPRNLPITLYKDNRVEGWKENYITKLPSGEIVCIYNDLTEKKKAEEEKKKLEKQLTIADKLKTVGSLAAGVAHNFNNISTIVQNNLNIIFYKNNDETLKKHFEEAFNAISSTRSLTKSLLAGSKDDNRVTKKIYNINEILLNSVSMFNSLNKSIIINTDCEGEIFVNIDSDHFIAIFVNLLVNATYAMNYKGIINVCSKIEGDRVHLSFEDNGCGINKDIQKHIFDPFFTTKGDKGTGVGLYTAYQTIKDHDGDICVYSEIDKGTIFNIYIPYNSNDKMNKDKIITSSEIIKGNNEFIMIVDDEEGIRESFINLLEIMDYRGISFASGKEALKYYTNNFEKVDLIIIDLIMPNMSGSQLFSRLQYINPKAKVIVASGFSKGEVIQKLLDSGCKDVINKPYHLGTLSKILNQTLRS